MKGRCTLATKINIPFIHAPLLIAGTLIDGTGDEITRIIERVGDPIVKEVARLLKEYPELERSKGKAEGEGEHLSEDSYIHQCWQLDRLNRMQKLVDELRLDAEAIRTKHRNMIELAEAFNGA